MDTPEVIKKYLVRDEIVEELYELNKLNVFTTNVRVLIQKGRDIKDISYAYISSIERKAESKRLMVIIGILLIAFNFLWAAPYLTESFIEFSVMYPLGPHKRMIDRGQAWTVIHFWGIIGSVLLITGFFWKNQCIRLSVSGMSRGLTLFGRKKTLDALFHSISNRRISSIKVS